MEKLLKLMKSRTFWTIVFMFVFNGYQAVAGFFTPEVNVVVNGVLSLLATYFKISPSQRY